MTKKSVLMLSDDPHVARACTVLDVDLTTVYGFGQKDFGMVTIPSGTRQVFAEDAGPESVILGLLRAGIDPSSFDAVYSTDEGGVVPAALLGQALSTPSIPLEVAARFRDKSLAKAALREAGVDTAEFVVIDDLCELPADYELPFAKAVLKPVVGGATWCASVIRSIDDLQAAAARVRSDRRGRPRTYILEEFVSGEEWHADGVMFNGELRFISVGGYQQTCLTTIESGDWLHTYVFDPRTDAEVYDLVTPLAERVLTTLGLDNGVFHMELFYDEASRRLVFGECAARRGGGLIEEEVFRKFGVSLAQAAVQCALGQPPTLAPLVRPEAIGCVYLPYHPGVLFASPSAADLAELPNVEFALVDWPIGFTMNPLVSTIMKIGQVMLAADDRDKLLTQADEVVAWFADRTVILPHHATAAQLRQWHGTFAQDGPRAPTAWKAGAAPPWATYV